MDTATTPLRIDTSIDPDPSTTSTATTTPATPVTPSTPSTPSMLRTTPASAASQQKRRSSTRSIKRKKFDDELVESSLAKTERSRPRIASTSLVTSTVASVTMAPLTPLSSVVTQAPLTPDIKPIPPTPPAPEPIAPTPIVETAPSVTMATATPLPVSAPSVPTPPCTSAAMTTPVTTQAAELIPALPLTPLAPIEKKKSKSSSKRSKKSKPPPAGSTKDLGRWKPQDDLALINAVQQTCDLTAVFHGVKFSCKFTLKEIQERWYALLYDSVLSKLAVQAMKQLHPDVMADINSKALFSKEEENILKKITSTSQPTVDTFQEKLSKHPADFHPGRTPKSLFNHWLLMKQYHLLPDQSVPPMPKGDHVLNFSDAEDMINEEELREPKDELLEHELMIADRRQKREIRHVEQELPKWQVLVDSVTGISPPDFDNQTLAVLRGRLVRYLMRSREITLGRATDDNQIDVDLSLEGPAWKISRKQGMIKLKNNGEFYIANEGKRPLYIDGKPILMGSKQKLNNNSVVEISCLRFIFLINQDLINVIRQDSLK